MKAPLIKILLPFVLGIVLAEVLDVPATTAFLLAALCALAMVGVQLLPRQRERLTTGLFRPLLYAAFLLLGLGLATLQREAVVTSFPPEPCTMELRLCEMPASSERYVKASAILEWTHNSNGSRPYPKGTRTLVYLDNDSLARSLSMGDRIIAYGTLRLPSDSRQQHQFDYRKFLLRRGIGSQTSLHAYQYRVLEHREGGMLRFFARLRGRMIGVIRQSNLTESQQGIAEALLLGWKNDVDETTQEQFRQAGLTHLLCVSGLHVGIVALIIGWILKELLPKHRHRVVRALLQMAGVWFFVLLTGAAPPTLRAGVMFSFLIVGKLCFTWNIALNCVAASALVLLVSRTTLLYEVGFQLSYSAVTGILLFVNPLTNLIAFPSNEEIWHQIPMHKRLVLLLQPLCRFAEKVWQLACVSLVAQLSALPFILYHFHSFPTYFLIANLTIVPFASLLLATALLLVLFAWFKPLFALLGWCLKLELMGTDAVTRWVSSLPHASLEGLYFDAPMAVLTLALLCLAGWLVHSRQRPRWIPYLIATTPLLLLGHYGAKMMILNNQKCLTLYSSGRTFALEVMEGRESLLLLSDSTTAPSSLDFATQGNLTFHGIKQRHHTRFGSPLPEEEQRLFPTLSFTRNHLLFGDRSLAIVDRNNYAEIAAVSRTEELPQLPTRLDYVVVCDNIVLSLEQLKRCYQFDTLVIASSNNAKASLRWRKECEQSAFPYVDITRDGALNITLSR